MILRHGLSVHEVGDERSVFHRFRDRDRVGVPVDRGEGHVVRARLHLRPVEQVAQRHARPQRGRDEVPADVVGDALERVDLLDGLEIEELVIRE